MPKDLTKNITDLEKDVDALFKQISDVAKEVGDLAKTLGALEKRLDKAEDQSQAVAKESVGYYEKLNKQQADQAGYYEKVFKQQVDAGRFYEQAIQGLQKQGEKQQTELSKINDAILAQMNKVSAIHQQNQAALDKADDALRQEIWDRMAKEKAPIYAEIDRLNKEFDRANGKR